MAQSSSPQRPTLADFAFARKVQTYIRGKLNAMGLQHMPNLPTRDTAEWLVEQRLTSTFEDHNGTNQIGNPLSWWISGNHQHHPLNTKQGNTLVYVVAREKNWVPVTIGMFVNSIDDVYEVLTSILDERDNRADDEDRLGDQPKVVELLRKQIEERSLIIQEVPKDAIIRIDWANRSI